MASFFRWRIANKVLPFLTNLDPSHFSPAVISSFVKVSRVGTESQLFLPWKKLTELAFDNINLSPYEMVKNLKNQGLPTSEGITDIYLETDPLSIVFTIDKHVYSKIVLMDICANEEIISKSSCLFQNVSCQNIVINCRTPHLGESLQMVHFRSHIHQNFIANINKMAGNQTKKILHVTDWGLLSAALLLGYRLYGSSEKLEKNPCRHLSEVLVSSRSLYAKDSKFLSDTKSCFKALEEGDNQLTSELNYLRTRCLDQYKSIFKKINISFDEIICDSLYFKEINKVKENLLRQSLISVNESNKITVKSAQEENEDSTFINDELNCLVFNISREIYFAQLLKEKHSFDKIIYVGPSSGKMFYSLVLNIIREKDPELSQDMQFVALRNIKDLTSKGKTKHEFENILQRSTVAIEQQLNKNLNMECNEELNRTAECLSLSSLIVNDMKHKRNLDYSFQWEDILSCGKDTGASLQLCYAGLKGLQQDSEYIFNVESDTSPLSEHNAQKLVRHLSRFDEMVHKAYLKLEPCHLLQYLFTLWYLVDKSADVLKLDIKDEKLTVIKARLMLLSASLKVLEKGLRLLGLEPYETKSNPVNFFAERKL